MGRSHICYTSRDPSTSFVLSCVLMNHTSVCVVAYIWQRYTISILGLKLKLCRIHLYLAAKMLPTYLFNHQQLSYQCFKHKWFHIKVVSKFPHSTSWKKLTFFVEFPFPLLGTEPWLHKTDKLNLLLPLYSHWLIHVQHQEVDLHLCTQQLGHLKQEPSCQRFEVFVSIFWRNSFNSLRKI